MTINYDNNFIKTLRQKLTVGNARSVHLNSLPGRYATRLDLANLSIVKPNLPDDFISILLSKPNFSFEISFNHLDPSKLEEDQRNKINLLAKRLNSLYYENNDNYLEFGIKTFGFGFPLLIRRDKQNNASIIAAPLLIWNLDLQKSATAANKWIIKREDDFPLTLNEVLVSHIQKDENITINRLDGEYLEDSIIDLDELNKITNETFEQLGIKAEHSFEKVERCIKDKSELKNLTQDKPWVLWAGIFGLYRSQKESLIKEYDKLLEKPDLIKPEQLKPDHYTTSSVSAVETDPSQIGILNALQNENQIIIQGPPGCGKSQSLTALISNALVEKKKCLIVCEKKTALDVIYNNLERVGLNELCVIIDDVYKDRQAVVKNVRQRIDEFSRIKTAKSYEYEFFIDQVNKYREQINKTHISLNELIYGDNNWTEVVALFLKSHKKSAKTELESLLNIKDFKYSFDEYNRYDSILAEALKLLSRLVSFEHPLFMISSNLFAKDQSFLIVKEEIKKNVEILKDKIADLDNLKSGSLNEYNIFIDKNYSNLNSKLNQDIADLSDRINKNINLTPLFNSNSAISKIKLTFLSIFSKKFKQVKLDKKNLYYDFQSLLNEIKQYELFGVEWQNVVEPIDYDKVLVTIRQIKTELKNWWTQLPQYKSSIVDNFNSLQVVPGIKYQDSINKIFVKLKTIVNEINSLHLIRKLFVIEGLSSLNDIEIISNELKIFVKDIESNYDKIRELNSYYEFERKLSESEKEFISKIFKQSINDLRNKFRSWYLFWLLANYENDKPRSDEPIKELLKIEEELKKAQLNKIVTTWRNKQSKAIDRFKNKGTPIQTLYNLKGAAGNKRNPLRKIISSDFNFFTDFYPVILTNPVACSSIIPLKQNIFDFVIFDEASQLRIEDTFTSVIRGKYKIISGDKHQMPPSNYFGSKVSVEDAEEFDKEDEEVVFTESESLQSLADSESLLSFAESSGFRYSPLDIHYRSRHPHLINFSNAAFYGSRLIPMPPKSKDKPIRFFEVGGIYETHIGVNQSEAAKAVEILKSHLPDFISGKYESIGIATLNLYQRNRILELIRLEQQNDANFASILDQLISTKNFFVKNLENIQGDEKDIIILSTTFGVTADGKFIQNFGPLNQEKGYKLLNVIITRAKYKFYVCTSIPPNYYQRYSEELKARGNVGKAIFYSYLAYAKAVEEDNHLLIESILNLLASGCNENNQTFSGIIESVFEQEVVDYLTQFIDPERIITQYKIGGFRIDIVVQPLNGNSKPIAIECDGASFHSSPEAYAWDMFRQKRLEENGFIFHRIWSANWWENPEGEIKKLVDFIGENDI